MARMRADLFRCGRFSLVVRSRLGRQTGFLPDLTLLTSGEWLDWVVVVALMYGPLAFAGWMIAKAYRNDG